MGQVVCRLYKTPSSAVACLSHAATSLNRFGFISLSPYETRSKKPWVAAGPAVTSDNASLLCTKLSYSSLAKCGI